MADESNVLPTSRIARWLAFVVLIALAVAFYFRDGRRLAPLTAPSGAPGTPAAPTTPAPDQPTN